MDEILLPPRHPGLARGQESLLVVIDCQERLWPKMEDPAALESRIGILLDAASVLEVPVLFTEQYRKGLGPTVPGLLARRGDAPLIEKATFSCGGDPAFIEAVHRSERRTLVLCGIESHICVLQTALDGLALGYGVHVVADAIQSRKSSDRLVAMERLRQAGAVVTTTESVLMEWMERCDRPAFKAISGLIK